MSQGKTTTGWKGLASKPPADPPNPVTGGRVIGVSETEFGKGQIDERNFYISAGDRKTGEGKLRLDKETTITIPKWLAAEMSQLIEDPILPYRNRYDIIRDSLVQRVHYLGKRQERDDPSYQMFSRMAEVERIAFEAMKQDQSVERIREVLAAALQGSDLTLLNETYEHGLQVVNTLREPYRGRLSQVLEEYEQASRFKKVSE